MMSYFGVEPLSHVTSAGRDLDYRREIGSGNIEKRSPKKYGLEEANINEWESLKRAKGVRE